MPSTTAPTSFITDLFKSAVTDTRNVLSSVLDVVGSVEQDARGFLADTGDAAKGSILSSKDVVKDFASSTRDQSKAFTDESRDELASYVGEVRDDVADLAKDIRSTAVQAVSSLRTRSLGVAKDGLETVRAGSEKLTATAEG